jgi:hypothetical protein
MQPSPQSIPHCIDVLVKRLSPGLLRHSAPVMLASIARTQAKRGSMAKRPLCIQRKHTLGQYAI